MVDIQVRNLTKFFVIGENLLDNLSFEIQEGERVAILGRNGCGKTTLFNILTGQMDYDSGEVYVNPNKRLGLISQIPKFPAGYTVEDVLRTAYAGLMKLKARMERLEADMAGGATAEQLREYDSLSNRFQSGGGYEMDVDVDKVCNGLGIPAEQRAQEFDSLSGGEKTRANLARLLLEKTDILLLDEPTNHLDLRSVEWLEGYIQNFRGTVLAISHDRYFLDKVTNRTIELENCHIRDYKGNYTRFLELKAEDLERRRKEYEAKMREIGRIEGIIDQQKRWNQAHNYVTIASKQKQIDRIASDLEKPEDAPDSLHFSFKSADGCGNDVFEAHDIALSFDGKRLFRNVNIDIKKGERVFLIGGNGCGKTSLFKIFTGQYTPDFGSFKYGSRVQYGYFDQAQAGLTDSKTAIDELWDAYPRMTETQVRTALGSFLFRGDDVFKHVSELSGGERARIAILKLMLSGANMLLLDEPTNHLDISSCEALENALLNYDGTLFVISHDRYLINKLADRIYYLTPDGVKEYRGSYDAYTLAAENAAQVRQEEKPAKQEKVNDYKLKKERDSERRKLNTKVTRAEAEIEELDSLIEQKTNELSGLTDYQKAMELSNEIEELRTRQEQAMQTWEEASLALEEFDK